MTQASPPATHPVDREHLDLRFNEFEARIDKHFAELELRTVERIATLERRFTAGAGVLMVTILGTLLAVLVK